MACQGGRELRDFRLPGPSKTLKKGLSSCFHSVYSALEGLSLVQSQAELALHDYPGAPTGRIPGAVAKVYLSEAAA